jgi:hypothetical protein
MLTPSFPPGVNTLLFRRMVGRTDNFTPGDNSTPRGQNSPLGAKLRMGLSKVKLSKRRMFQESRKGSKGAKAASV